MQTTADNELRLSDCVLEVDYEYREETDGAAIGKAR